jgi:hypothetical protein
MMHCQTVLIMEERRIVGIALKAQRDRQEKGTPSWQDIMKPFRKETSLDGSLLLHREVATGAVAVKQGQDRRSPVHPQSTPRA